MPSRRVVVVGNSIHRIEFASSSPSEAITFAFRSALAIASRAASSGSAMRRNALAMAPCAIRSPNSSAHDPAQPLEADMMTVVEVEQKRVDARRERRARRHARGRLGPEPAAATGAAPAQKLDPRGVRHDRRDVDMVVAVAHLLGLPGDVRSTLAAGVGPAPQRLVRLLCASRRDVPGREGRGVVLSPLPGRLALVPEDGGRCEFLGVFWATTAWPRAPRSGQPAPRSTPPDHREAHPSRHRSVGISAPWSPIC